MVFSFVCLSRRPFTSDSLTIHSTQEEKRTALRS